MARTNRFCVKRWRLYLFMMFIWLTNVVLFMSHKQSVITFATLENKKVTHIKTELEDIIMTDDNSNHFHQRRKRNAIQYLTQKQHSSYKYNTERFFIQSIKSLFKYYINNPNCISKCNENIDVYIFHTGDFTENDLQYMLNLDEIFPFNNIYLSNLNNTKYFSKSSLLRNDISKDWIWGGPKGFTIGYRHMIRWNAFGVWEYFNNIHGIGYYNYIMRMDDESLFHSYINYNLFEYMSHNDMNYGYRIFYMPETGHYNIKPYLKDYLTNNKFHKGNITANIDKANEYYNHYINDDNIPFYIFEDLEVYLQGDREAISGKYKWMFFYNNWYIGKISFFMRPYVQNFLHYIDLIGIIYRNRLNDINIHSATVLMFSPPNKIHQFIDFTYSHTKNWSDCHQTAYCVGINHINYENNFINTFAKHCLPYHIPITDLSHINYQSDLSHITHVQCRVNSLLYFLPIHINESF
eukprot:127057_1